MNTVNVKNGVGSRRCPLRNSVKSPARADGRRTKRARRTSGRRMKPATRAERAARSAAAAGAVSLSQPIRPRPVLRLAGKHDAPTVSNDRFDRADVLEATNMARRVAVACVIALAVAASARAQSGSSGTSTGQSTTATQTQSSSTATAEETRPATTTFFGDTGLWFVPTAEVLAHKKWSVSGYRRGTNWIQGYTNVADFAGDVRRRHRGPRGDLRLVPGRHAHRPRRAPGLRHRSDLRQLHRSLSARQPVLDRRQHRRLLRRARSSTSCPSSASSPAAARAARHGQAADRRRRRRASAPARPISPSTSSPARKRQKLVEVAGFGGYEWRGSPDGFDIPGGAFRWGAGLGFPSRNWLRVTGELNGLLHVRTMRRRSTARRRSSASTAAARCFVGEHGQASRARPSASRRSTKKRLLLRRRRELERADRRPRPAVRRRRQGRRRRLLRLAVPDRVSPRRARLRPAAAAAAARATTAGAARRTHTLTVRAECNPCSVEVGQDVRR